MKKFFNSAFILCSLLASIFTMGACGSSDDNNNYGGSGNNEEPVIADTIGSVTRPTDWIVNDSLYYPSAMTFVITQPGIPATIDEQDLIAAFINDKCQAVTSPLSDLSGFFLSVRCPQGKENDTNLKIVLRYYSAKEKAIYTSNEITFIDNVNCGDLDNSYIPVWNRTSK